MASRPFRFTAQVPDLTAALADWRDELSRLEDAGFSTVGARRPLHRWLHVGAAGAAGDRRRRTRPACASRPPCWATTTGTRC